LYLNAYLASMGGNTPVPVHGQPLIPVNDAVDIPQMHPHEAKRKTPRSSKSWASSS